MRRLILGFMVLCVLPVACGLAGVAGQRAQTVPLFAASDRCQACHNGLRTPSGDVVSMGVEWRASVMAHTARDPYWMASVRREVMDHPGAQAAIEHECSRCHMPMAHFTQVAAGGTGTLFEMLQAGAAHPHAALAADGTSCTVCHQVRPDSLGSRESFNGRFAIDTATPVGMRAVYGPFPVKPGPASVMRSASNFTPAESPHVTSSELCGSCHTLFTHALGAEGNGASELPEQAPYLEWQHSAYRETKGCVSCHMPLVQEPVPIATTLGESRRGVVRHTFRGGNAFMLRMLDRQRADLGVTVAAKEMDAAARDTEAFLQRETASLSIEGLARPGGRVQFTVAVANRAGHKFPSAYPSRRAWLHVTVRDAAGAVLFESGALAPEGRIAGNDNDADAAAYEAHHGVITAADQVQIYEDIMVDAAGRVTTGLLSGVRYVKDNRLLPDGFDKRTASADVAVQGDALGDEDFVAGGDRVRYDVEVKDAGAVTVEAELLYQPVGFRWAENLRQVRAAEPERFVRFYEAARGTTAVRVAHASGEAR